jgi:hypothetical protein
MAIAYTRVASYPDKYQIITDVTADGSYASGGYLLDAKQLGVLAIDAVDATSVTGDGLTITYVSSTGKLKVFKSAGAAGQHTEVVSGDLTTANKFRCNVTGRPIL